MPRQIAWELLMRDGGPPLREVEGAAEARELEPRDRALLRQIVGTEVRRRATLRKLVHHFCPSKPKRGLAMHLHVAFAQAFFLDRIPDHAILNQALGCVRRSGWPHELRAVRHAVRAALDARRPGASGDPRRDLPLRELHFDDAVFADPREHPMLWAEQALSMPAPLVKRWTQRYGEQRALDLARYALTEPALSVRVVRGARSELLAELRGVELHPRESEHASILLLPPAETSRLLASAPFREGRVSVQGQAALEAAEALEAQEGERVLDLCAAPGGKTAVLAATGAQVLAVDVRPERVERVRAGLERTGSAERVELAVSDGTREIDAGFSFDAVLLDAPCSNTGVLAARPEARWRWGPKTKRELNALQTRLLDEGAARVRPGGRLVWSTCSLEPEENGQLVRAFAARAGWQLELERETLPDTSGPKAPGPVDGGYFARLRRSAD